jgi:hypothetical protein
LATVSLSTAKLPFFTHPTNSIFKKNYEKDSGRKHWKIFPKLGIKPFARTLLLSYSWINILGDFLGSKYFGVNLNFVHIQNTSFSLQLMN